MFCGSSTTTMGCVACTYSNGLRPDSLSFSRRMTLLSLVNASMFITRICIWLLTANWRRRETWPEL